MFLGLFGKKEEQKEEEKTFLKIEMEDDGILLITSSCKNEDYDKFSELLFMLNYGYLLGPIVESLKDALEDNKETYAKILNNLMEMYQEELERKENEVDIDEALIKPSEVFSREKNE